jgi:hypothetical protein
MENKVIITNNEDSVNRYLDKGWIVKSVTPQFVATGASFELKGYFCFVLERPI